MPGLLDAHIHLALWYGKRVCWAGALKLIGAGVIDSKDRVVCELTGTELKSSKEFVKVVANPFEVNTSLESLIKALKQRL